MNNDFWQEDWNAFTNILEEHLKEKKTDNELTDRFTGKPVRWRGQLEEKHFDDDSSPRVVVLMPERRITLDGSFAVLNVLTIWIAADAKRAWQDAEIGSTVMFTAKFDDAGSLLPPIYVLDVGGGQVAVMIGLSGGRVVG